MQYRFKDSPWDLNSVECYEFYHVDWRESDVVIVYSPDDKRIGFIVSQSVLFTEDNEILEQNCLSNYLTRWLKDSLNCQFDDLSLKIEECLVLEDNLCYLLLHKPSLSYLRDAKDAIFALMYSCCFSIERKQFDFFSSETNGHFRNRIASERLRILPIFSTEASKYFLNECIPKLHTISDPLSQFVLLYQFFEVLMEVSFEPKLKIEYTKFENRSICKNEFRHNVSNLSKESTLMTELLRKISNKSFDLISDDEKKRFLGDPDISLTSDLVYKLRNTIFHRTRVFMNSEEMLRKVNYAILSCIYECMKTNILHEQIHSHSASDVTPLAHKLP